MCGICGIWGVPDAPAGDGRVAGMLQTIVHRGPDGEGRLARDGVALGMRRLAIIDLAGGDQPIHNEDRTTHNIQVFDPRLEFNSGAQEPGQTVELKFPSGAFTVFCGIHPKMKLRVQAE